ncbi:PhoH family protein [Streptomyces albireticuli]|uniref:PhoH-like protein n=1 Tax=Streptomyces albireticuli TaxID=1940 RepID=A0A2A2DCX7_9ACTN|nr:PhoH family protein [Streptomyces albireticuli]MCD9141819.1 PhoH family protein [Streptomyces albireticuli]MCD9163237.1 PhoH family protein [Streptomyces albireticuli]MCD9189992.1 PhoH family protein [Streptomyces albireticuli]PAU49365.1 phosphate starvation-inducible protein PhoH [Streptomyces albireticuli]
MTQTPTQPQATARFTVPAKHPMVTVLGSGDSLLRVIEKAFPGTDIHVRGNEVSATGAPGDVALVQRLFDEMMLVLRTGQPMTEDAVERSIAMLRDEGESGGETPAEVLTQNILSNRGRTIRPKTLNQKRYVDAIDKHTVVFGIGPAGTGKTYLAMAKAVQALQSKQVNRIILTRPAVEAGERLGFLPGTLYEKIDPYLRPLYDALHDMLDPDSIPRLMAAGTIEVAPLAYMRGRAHPTFTNVLTPDGWRPIGSLQVGDLVVGSNGEPTPVLGVYPQGEKDIYRVSAQDGSWTLCCGEHLWTVRTRDDKRRDKPWRVLETQEMIGNLRAAHYRRYELPILTAPVQFTEHEVPIDPYALGLLLGDGCIAQGNTPSFTTADPELISAVEAAVPDIKVRSRGGYNYLVNRVPTLSDADGTVLTHPLKQALRKLDLLGSKAYSKFVPDDYLYNSAEVRLAVLQGLLDTDGGPVTQSDRTCRIQYTTTSILLRDDVIALVQSLGGVAYTRRRAAEGRNPGRVKGRDVQHRHDAHIVDIRLPEGVEPFRLARKAETYRAAGGGGRPMRFIDSIEPAGREEAVCIQVAAEDSLYVTQDYLLTHNTLNDAFIILDEAQNTSAEQMKMFLTRLGFDSKIVVTGDITQIDLPGGTKSGLRQVQDILEGVEDVHFARLTSTDVVRHKLVGRIVDAYEQFDSRAGL